MTPFFASKYIAQRHLSAACQSGAKKNVSIKVTDVKPKHLQPKRPELACKRSTLPAVLTLCFHTPSVASCHSEHDKNHASNPEGIWISHYDLDCGPTTPARSVDDPVFDYCAVPLNVDVSGLVVALLLTVNVPFNDPFDVGANSTQIVHLEPADRDDPQ